MNEMKLPRSGLGGRSSFSALRGRAFRPKHTYCGFGAAFWVGILVFLVLSLGFPQTADAAGSIDDITVAGMLPLRRLLLITHVLGLIFGFGATLFLVLLMVRHLYHAPLTTHVLDTFKFGSVLVGVGLKALWISGIGFLALYAYTEPSALDNSKLWAKLLVVCILTVNGVLIDLVVLPHMRKTVGTPLLTGKAVSKAFPFLFIAVLSTTGWCFSFVLGMIKELNAGVSAATFLLVYGGIVFSVLLVAVTAHIILSFMTRDRNLVVAHLPTGKYVSKLGAEPTPLGQIDRLIALEEENLAHTASVPES